MSLKDRLSQADILVAPGVYDALSASLAEQARFEAVFLSGSAVAYSQLARPDVGLVTMTEMANTLDRVRDRVGVHIFVDADSGFGNALNVGRTVRAFERAGASAIQIEDQENTKAMANVGKRPLISQDAMVDKVKAALDARESADTLISARSDAVFTESVDQAIERANAYADAGADIVFVEGLTSSEDWRRLCSVVGPKAPVLFNLMKPGADGSPTFSDLQDVGYSIALCPGVAIGAAANAAFQALSDLAGRPASENRTMADLIQAEAYLSARGDDR